MLTRARIGLVLAVATGLSGSHLGTHANFSAVTTHPGNRITVAGVVAPTGVSATVRPDARTVRLTWTASTTTTATGYRIYRTATAGGPYTQAGEVSGRTTTTFDDTPSDGTWRYVVRALEGTHLSPVSTETGAVTTQTVDHFDIDPIAEQHSGKSFTVTVRARTAANALVSGYGETATLSTNNGTISPTTGTFSAGVLTQTVTITGAYSAAQTVTATAGTPAKSKTSAAFTLHDWVFPFKKTAPASGTGCVTGTDLFEMAEGYAGLDPESVYDRVDGGVASFCTPAVTAATTLPAGTTTFYGWFNNTAGSSCAVTATVLKNGTTTIGSSVTQTFAAGSALAERSWAITTPAIALAAGDRLTLRLNWQAVKACNTTFLHHGGTANRSRIVFPKPT